MALKLRKCRRNRRRVVAGVLGYPPEAYETPDLRIWGRVSGSSLIRASSSQNSRPL